MREADRRAIEEIGIPGVVLMENAGRGAAQVALAMLEGVHRPNVVILAGRGNNGGDGYVIARHLANAGAHVHVRLLAKFDDVKGDAETNLRIIRNMKLDVREIDLAAGADSLAGELKDAHLIVDAMLGTGAKGEIREPFASAIEAVNASGRHVLALDIPSGLHGDTGKPLGHCVVAQRTATFAAAKQGLLEESARPYAGEINVVDIGMPRELLERQA